MFKKIIRTFLVFPTFSIFWVFVQFSCINTSDPFPIYPVTEKTPQFSSSLQYTTVFVDDSVWLKADFIIPDSISISQYFWYLKAGKIETTADSLKTRFGIIG